MIKKFEAKIDYVFKKKEIIEEALTHSSYANENKVKVVKFNERLEFLGDSVLSIVISNFLFLKYPNSPEGDLTKLRAKIVCETSLSEVAQDIKLGESLRLGRGEEMTGGRTRMSILADAFEAVIAAIFLDAGFDIAEKFILNTMSEKIEEAVSGSIMRDHKTRLQEIIQAKTKSKLAYEIYKEEGPDHNKVFFSNVNLAGKILGSGSGGNKKEAEQAAAKEAIKGLE